MLFCCISLNMGGFFFSEPHDENDYNFCRAECNQMHRILFFLLLLQIVLDFVVFTINGAVVV